MSRDDTAEEGSDPAIIDGILERLDAADPLDHGLPVAVEAMGVSGDSRTVDVLSRALWFRLADADTDLETGLDVRWAAACSLGRLGDVRGVPALAKALLEHDDDVIGRAAAWALGAIGDRDAIPALVEAIRRQDPEGRWEQAVYALARLDAPSLDAILEDLRAWRLKQALGLAPLERASEIRALRLWDNEWTGCDERRA